MRMSFDWKEKTKEKYYRKARKQIKGLKYKEIKIDKDRFGVIGSEKVKVYIKPLFTRDSREIIKELTKTDNFTETSIEKDNFGRKKRGIIFCGCFEYDLEKKDR